MGLDTLLAAVKMRADTPDTSCKYGEVSAKPAQIKACTPDTPDTPEKTITANQRHFMWQLETRSRGTFPLSTWPPSTLTEVLRDFPDTVSATPMPDEILI